MKLRLALPKLDAVDELPGGEDACLVLTSFADDRPLRGLTGLCDWRLNGQLSRLLQRDFIDGHYQDAMLVPITGRLPFGRVLLVGLGKRSDFNAQRFEDVCRFCFAKLLGMGTLRFAMALPGRIGLDVGVRQALAGWRRAVHESFPPETLADLDISLLEAAEVQRELVEPMRNLERELNELAARVRSTAP